MSQPGTEGTSVVNSGQMIGVAVGGRANRVAVDSSNATQGNQLAVELASVLRELEQGPHNDQERLDMSKVREAIVHAEGGSTEAARKSLLGVGRWVSEVARRVGATLVTEELKTLMP